MNRRRAAQRVRRGTSTGSGERVAVRRRTNNVTPHRRRPTQMCSKACAAVAPSSRGSVRARAHRCGDETCQDEAAHGEGSMNMPGASQACSLVANSCGPIASLVVSPLLGAEADACM